MNAAEIAELLSIARLVHPLQLQQATRLPQPQTPDSSPQRAEQPRWELPLAGAHALGLRG
jgi:hypothetical protein